MLDTQAAQDLLGDLQAGDWVAAKELATIEKLFQPCFPFADAVGCAESIHVHIKVDDVNDLSRDELHASGGCVEYEKEGFLKFSFPSGVNVIFSSIAVSQDELVETECSRRPRPFVDHIGIDLRDESEGVRNVFEAIPVRSQSLGWERVGQGDEGHGVHCCHVEVKQKEWVYPPSDGAPGSIGIPLEFAFGRLTINDEAGGCDLRPMAPSVAKSSGVPACGESKS